MELEDLGNEMRQLAVRWSNVGDELVLVDVVVPRSLSAGRDQRHVPPRAKPPHRSDSVFTHGPEEGIDLIEVHQIDGGKLRRVQPALRIFDDERYVVGYRQAGVPDFLERDLHGGDDHLEVVGIMPPLSQPGDRPRSRWQGIPGQHHGQVDGLIR